VLRFASTGRASRGFLTVGFVAVALQLCNLLGIGFARELAPYPLGVIGHVCRFGVLFVWLIRIPAEDVESA